MFAIVILLCSALEIVHLHQSAGPADFFLEELLSPGDYRKYQTKPEYKHRMNVYREAMDDYAKELRNHVRQRRINGTLLLLQKVRLLSKHAMAEPSRASASSKDLRAKEVRKMEIRLRRLLTSLEEIKLLVSFEHAPEVDAAARDIEALRDQLLGQIFGRVQPGKKVRP